jgi:hypothetical protein
MEVVHVIKPSAEPAERNGDLNVMRKVALNVSIGVRRATSSHTRPRLILTEDAHMRSRSSVANTGRHSSKSVSNEK